MMKRALLTLTIFTLLTVGVEAKSITWDPNTEADLAGYRVYLRDLPDGAWSMGTEVKCGPDIQVKIPLSDLGVTTEGHEYYITAFDISGNESDPSNTVDDVGPSPPGACRLISD